MKIYWLLLGSVVMLVVGGCSTKSLLPGQSDDKNNPQGYVACSYSSKEGDLYNQAVDRSEVKLCQSIKENCLRNMCFRDIARNTDNSEICDNIGDDVDRDDCYQLFFYGDKSFNDCEKITNSSWAFGCYKDNNYQGLTVDICQKLKKQDSFEANECFANMAVQNQDHSLCLNIDKEYDFSQITIGGCLADVGWFKIDKKLCPKLSFDQELTDNCYAAIGVAKADPAICDQVQEEDLQNSCRYHAVVNTKSYQACDDYDEGTDCKRAVAALIGDVDYCIAAQDDGSFSEAGFNDCFAQIAIVKKDPSVCNSLTKRKYMTAEDSLSCESVTHKALAKQKDLNTEQLAAWQACLDHDGSPRLGEYYNSQEVWCSFGLDDVFDCPQSTLAGPKGFTCFGQ